VEKAIDSQKDMLVALHQRSSHRIAERIWREFLVYTVTPENREIVVDEIAEKILKS
jgi:nucleoside-triphosphatase THEP1